MPGRLPFPPDTRPLPTLRSTAPLRVLAGGGKDLSPRRRDERPPLRVIAGGSAPKRRSFLDEAGQASVEFVALLPLLVVVVALAWQAALAGQAVWEARVAARAAARANAFGADAAAAARAHLPRGFERGLRVRAGDDGDVRVWVRVPSVLGVVRLGRVSATSHFRPQG